MAVKTITIDMEAYEALRRRKRAGQSFSDVIKAHFAGRMTGRSLAEAIASARVEGSTLDRIDELVRGRAQDPARSAKL